jgi:hypothetical protein
LYAGRLPASPVDPRTHGVLAVPEPRMGSVARPARTSEKKRGEWMLGTITRFSKLTTSGAIRSENG